MPQKTVRVAVIGAPNAGKSTLTNTLAGQLVRSQATLSAENTALTALLCPAPGVGCVSEDEHDAC